MRITERLLSFDPGDPHVGIALWVLDADDGEEGRWVCTQARECTPDQFADYCRDFVGKLTRVAYEVFRLGGGQEALFQKGSTFGTVECVGVARHHARWGGATFEGYERGVRRATLTRMKAVGWRFPAGASTHVKDAIAVGATAVGWRAANHFDGDGVRNPSRRAGAVS